MPKAFSDSDRKRIRAQLIGAGKSFLNRAEVRSLSVDQVSREAGISKGSFYSFFPTREEFILGVFESWESEFRTKLFASLTGEPGTPRERWERFFLGVYAVLDLQPGLARVQTQDVRFLMERLPPERMAAHQAEDRRALEEGFGRLVSLGLLDAKDIPGLAGVVTSIFFQCLNRHDYPAGLWEPMVRVTSEALAQRFSSPTPGVSHG